MKNLTIDNLDYVAAHGYQMQERVCQRLIEELFDLDTVELADGDANEQQKFLKLRDKAFRCEITRRDDEGVLSELDAILTFLSKWNAIGEAHASAVRVRDSLKRIFDAFEVGFAQVAEVIVIESAAYSSTVPSPT
jgi:hypothetical protein